MNQSLRSAILLTVLATVAPSVLAQTTQPYTCDWVSEVTPGAVITFTGTNGTGITKGSLRYKGEQVLPFEEGQYQGYGSNWWSTGAEDEPLGTIVVFADHRAVKGTPAAEIDNLRKGQPRVLIVGLGRSIWYNQDLRWRRAKELLTAGEGFWKPREGCRKMF